jgi:hypothetical protein
MRRLKTIQGLTVVILLVAAAITTTAASANFEANGNTSQGPYTISGAGTFNTSAIGVTCSTIERGEWHIQKSDTAQELTKQGGHQQLTGQFTKCTAEIAGLKAAASINAACAQQIKVFSIGPFKVSIEISCSIRRGLCTLTIGAGAPNTELSEVKVVNIAAGNEDTSNVSGITSVVNKSCEELGLSGNKEGTAKVIGIATGEKLI